MNGVTNRREEREPLILETQIPLNKNSQSRSKPSRLITVEPALVTFFVAVTAGNPINQQYLYSRFAEDYNFTLGTENTTRCETDEVSDDVNEVEAQIQKMASMWSIILIATDLLPSLVTTVLLGAYSDKAGRKKAMIPPIIGLTFRGLIALLVVGFHLPIPVLAIGSIVDGCLGGTFTMMMASLAYIADVTTLKQRPIRILAVEIFSGLGQTAANIGAGYLLSALGFFYPYLVIVAIDLFTLFYVIFAIRETVPKEPNIKLFACDNIRNGINVITRKTPNKRRWKIISSFFIFFLVSIMDFGVVEIITFYVLNPPFCWNSVLIGYFNSFSYVLQTVGSLIFLKLFYSCLKEYGLVVVSCLSGVGYYLILAQATSTLMIFIGPLIGLAFKLALPMIRAFNSKLVESDEQGSLFAVVCLVNILAVVVGNFLFNGLYAATYNSIHGLVFYMGAALFFIPIIASLVLIAVLKREERPKYGLVSEE